MGLSQAVTLCIARRDTVLWKRRWVVDVLCEVSPQMIRLSLRSLQLEGKFEINLSIFS